MDAILSYVRSDHLTADKQIQSALLISPWVCGMEGDSVRMHMFNPTFYSEAMKDSNFLTELYHCPDYRDVTTLIRSDVEDSPVPENILMVDVSTTKGGEGSSGINTKSEAINRENQAYLDYLRTRSDEIINAIIRTDFEDGMDNDVTLLFKKFTKKNKSATFNWIDELYSKNLNNPVVVEGLLRTLAMVTEKGDETILLPIVIASLRSEISVEQEAAIMVIEEWRTRECLNAIRSVHRFPSDMVADYANMVAKELEEELGCS